MSSEEVAELAQAIHSHADALYESWKQGPDVMRRMEDTLELLANPGLTPKLEHLVSNFVRQDKAKRQQQTTVDGTMSRNRMSRSPSPKLSNFDSSRDNLNTMNNLVNGNKKALPKSILAVVQRFETPPPSGSGVSEPSTVTTSSVVSTPSSTVLQGIGPVSKNLLWAESSSRQSLTEKNFGVQQRPVSPVPMVQGTNFLNGTRMAAGTSNNYGGATYPSVNLNPVPGRGREIHIPIERIEEDGTTSKILQGRVVGVARNESPKISRVVNLNSSRAPVIKDLEREEERLFRALQTGEVIPPNDVIVNHQRNPLPMNSGPIKSNNSRIEFAKERIRHSQEHPLTQQRLELQKRLPSPSGHPAAGIAAQQGRSKFEVVDGHNHNHHPVNNGHGHYLPSNIGGPLDDEKENSTGPGGRQSWVQRFGSGSSVAERVQLFEKYPSHIVNHNSGMDDHTVFHGHGNGPEPHYQNNSSVFKTNHFYTPKEIMHSISRASGDGNHNHYSRSVATISQSLKDQSGSEVPWRLPADVQSHRYKSDALVKRKTGSPRTPVAEILKESNVPRFHWPGGKPPPTSNLVDAIATAEDEFSKFATPLTYTEFGKFLVAIGIPLYWKRPFWNAIGLKADAVLDKDRFIRFYRRLLSECPDDASRFMRLVWVAAKWNTEDSVNNNDELYFVHNSKSKMAMTDDTKHMELSMSDFIPLIQDIIDTHPGLGFLRDAPEFHSRYVTTVISRIFYKVNRSWTGRITLSELRRSNVLKVIKRLEEETDVNAITEYFSYEHFYVIYCKFWELDKDHDLLIDKNDLAEHGQQALSKRIIDRIFSGTVIRGWDMSSSKCPPGKMTYSDFVWFLISEEDKKTPTAIEYWFRCLDIDGDGILTPYELQYFYSEQEKRIESLSIEPLDFSNVYCQIVDMLRCSPNGIRLQDLKRNPHLASNVFNTLFNLDKYLDHEQRDPFASAGPSGASDGDMPSGESDWDKYAAADYDLLISEESPSDHLHDNSDIEDGLMGLP